MGIAMGKKKEKKEREPQYRQSLTNMQVRNYRVYEMSPIESTGISGGLRGGGLLRLPVLRRAGKGSLRERDPSYLYAESDDTVGGGNRGRFFLPSHLGEEAAGKQAEQSEKTVSGSAGIPVYLAPCRKKCEPVLPGREAGSEHSVFCGV